MPKTPLFGQISVIAILSTQGVIFQSLPELAEINAHKPSYPTYAENVFIWPNLGARDFEHLRCDFPKFARNGWN